MPVFNETLFKTVVAPEFKTEPLSKLQPFIDEALLEVAESKWGKFHPRAWGLMTAHLLKMFDISQDGDSLAGNNQIKKDKVGDLETEYAVSGAKDAKDQDTFKLTIYGKELLRLRKRILKAPLFVSC